MIQAVMDGFVDYCCSEEFNEKVQKKWSGDARVAWVRERVGWLMKAVQMLAVLASTQTVLLCFLVVRGWRLAPAAAVVTAAAG